MGFSLSCLLNMCCGGARGQFPAADIIREGAKLLKHIVPYIVPYLGDMPSQPKLDVEEAEHTAENVVGFVPWDEADKSKRITRSLFIGINYQGTKEQLSGCCNDVKQVLATLKKKGFFLEETKILVDEEGFSFPHELPTRQNIATGMAWLSHNAKPGDVLFLHYSGHGVKARSSKDTVERYDQCLVPLDFKANGCILDDDIFHLLAARLPEGVRMTAVFDCCHSGTLLDLPYNFVGSRSLTRSVHGKMHRVRHGNDSRGDVLMISGCNDEQTSADVGDTAVFGTGSVGAGGATTQCLTYTLLKKQNLTYQDMLICTRDMLRERKFTQVPQLSSSKPIDLEQPFSLISLFKLDDSVMGY